MEECVRMDGGMDGQFGPVRICPNFTIAELGNNNTGIDNTDINTDNRLYM